MYNIIFLKMSVGFEAIIALYNILSFILLYVF